MQNELELSRPESCLIQSLCQAKHVPVNSSAEDKSWAMVTSKVAGLAQHGGERTPHASEFSVSIGIKVL